MPEPIKGNLNFEVCHNTFNADYTMRAMMACRDYYEIGLTISGDRKVIMQDHIHYQRKGVVSTTPMNVYLRTTPASNQIYERIMVKFKPAMADEFATVVGKEAFDSFLHKYVHTFTEENEQKILLLLKQMEEIYQNYNEYSELLLKGLLNQLLYLTYTKRLPTNPAETLFFNHTNPIIVEALYYMESTYMEARTLSDVALYVNVSREHLSRLFKRTVGVSFSEYQNKIRLRHAVEILENTDYSIEKISELSGFSNSNYMCDVFKKYIGTAPSHYRKQLLSKRTH